MMIHMHKTEDFDYGGIYSFVKFMREQPTLSPMWLPKAGGFMWRIQSDATHDGPSTGGCDCSVCKTC